MKRNKIIAGIVASAALATGVLSVGVGTADAAGKGNPWRHGLVIKHTERLTVGDWQRYARSKGAHHLGKIDGHKRCYVIYGPTSYVQCKDGWRTTS